MTEAILTIGFLALVLLGSVIWLAVKSAGQTKKLNAWEQKIKDLEKQLGQLKKTPTVTSDEIRQQVVATVEAKLGDLVTGSGMMTSNSPIAEAIAEKVVALLTNPVSQFSQQFASALSERVARKVAVPGALVDQIMRQSEPQLEEAVKDIVSRIANPDDGDDDPLAEAVREHLDEWVKQALADPAQRGGLVEKVVATILDRVEDLVNEEMDNYTTVEDALRDALPGILAAELSQPESELRRRLVKAVMDNAVSTLEG